MKSLHIIYVYIKEAAHAASYLRKLDEAHNEIGTQSAIIIALSPTVVSSVGCNE